MKDSTRYIKVVEWSEEDQCYIGSSPGLFFGGCHGNDEQAVFRDLCLIVDEHIADIHAEGQPLPPATAGRDLVRRQDVA
jgi:predicted RNase H-like HicB family nuclease